MSSDHCAICNIDNFYLTSGKILVKYRELEVSATSRSCKACKLLSAALRAIKFDSALESAEIKLYDSSSGTRFQVEFADGTVSPKFELFAPKRRYSLGSTLQILETGCIRN